MANIAIMKNFNKALGGIGYGLQAGSIFGQGYALGNYYDSVARQYDNQIELNRQLTANQNYYDSMSNAYRIRSVMSKGEQLFGSQKTALARGGDSTGNTARAIIKDSARKQAEDVAMIQFQNELQGFERERQARLEEISLEANRKMMNISADNARLSGILNGVSSLLSVAGTVASQWYNPTTPTTSNNGLFNDYLIQTGFRGW